MNKVILCGRLTRDPEVRYGGQKMECMAKYTLAVDRRVRTTDEQKQADFISCVAFGKTGEWAETHLKQGTKIMLIGRIQTRTYKDRDGKTVYVTEVIAEEQEFAEGKPAAAPAPAAPAAANPDEWLQVPEVDGLPFK